jgi:hypothetical protein
MPIKFTVETDAPFTLSGVLISLDTASGKAVAIKRVHIIDTELSLDGHAD